jgi:hypothetical protein
MMLARWRKLRTTTTLVGALVGWMWCGVTASIAMTAPSTEVTARHPAGIGVLIGAAGVATATAIGGLVLFWGIALELQFLKRGYRIRPARRQVVPLLTLSSGEWLYEERGDDGRVHALPFTRIVVAHGYPARTELDVPTEQGWDTQGPEWARGRRSMIIDRIVASCGGPAFARITRSGFRPSIRAMRSSAGL